MIVILLESEAKILNGHGADVKADTPYDVILDQQSAEYKDSKTKEMKPRERPGLEALGQRGQFGTTGHWRTKDGKSTTGRINWAVRIKAAPGGSTPTSGGLR